MSVMGMSGLESALTRNTATRDRAKIQDSAGKFEALLIAQMLKTARESGTGGLTGEENQTDSTMRDMAEECFSEVLSSQGGLGLGKLIAKHLAADKPPVAAPSPVEN